MGGRTRCKGGAVMSCNGNLSCVQVACSSVAGAKVCVWANCRWGTVGTVAKVTCSETVCNVAPGHVVVWSGWYRGGSNNCVRGCGVGVAGGGSQVAV